MSRKGLGLGWKKVVSFSCILGIFFTVGYLGDSLAEEESANLIKNPGFEDVYESKGTIVPKGWYIHTHFFVKPDGTQPKLSIDDQVSHSGKYSLKITGTNNQGGLNYKLVSKDYVESLGYSFSGKYRVSGWIKTYNMGGVDAHLIISYYVRKSEKEQWKYITGESVGTIQGTTDWTKVSKIITTPSDADLGLFEIMVWTARPNSGIAWFDDISLVKLGEKKENIVSKDEGKKSNLTVKKNTNNPGQPSGISRNLLSGDSSFESGMHRNMMSCDRDIGTVKIGIDDKESFKGKQSLKVEVISPNPSPWSAINGFPVFLEKGKIH